MGKTWKGDKKRRTPANINRKVDGRGFHSQRQVPVPPEAREELNAKDQENNALRSELAMLRLQLSDRNYSNTGRMRDFVLKEAPLESFNEYVFAATSHLCH